MRNASARSPDSAVFDASVFVRALLDDDESAQQWIVSVDNRDVALVVPDLVWAEVAHALKRAVAVARRDDRIAREALDVLLTLPARVRPTRDLVPAAFEVALQLGLSVYDACYLVLAQAAEATLVTFDRDFVGLYEPLELLA